MQRSPRIHFFSIIVLPGSFNDCVGTLCDGSHRVISTGMVSVKRMLCVVFREAVLSERTLDSLVQATLPAASVLYVVCCPKFLRKLERITALMASRATEGSHFSTNFSRGGLYPGPKAYCLLAGRHSVPQAANVRTFLR